jgi:hypothetical protein
LHPEELDIMTGVGFMNRGADDRAVVEARHMLWEQYQFLAEASD